MQNCRHHNVTDIPLAFSRRYGILAQPGAPVTHISRSTLRAAGARQRAAIGQQPHRRFGRRNALFGVRNDAFEAIERRMTLRFTC